MGRNDSSISKSSLCWLHSLSHRKAETMIFVILGTQKFQLNRLLKEVDELCGQGLINDEVFAQIGHSDYYPKNYKWVDFLDKLDFEYTISSCSLIITHSGVGSIISSQKSGVPVIVYPRLKKYKEHVDDHQLEIAQAFEKKNFVLCCHDGMKLGPLIKKSKAHVFDRYESSTDEVIELVRGFIDGE